MARKRSEIPIMELIDMAPDWESAQEPGLYPFVEELEGILRRSSALQSYFKFLSKRAQTEALLLVNKPLSTEVERYAFALTQGQIQGMQATYGTLVNMIEEAKVPPQHAEEDEE